MQTAQNQWYVQVSGQSYGPYSVEQMRSFIQEGRVIASSLISQDMDQGFAMAAAFPAFSPMLAPQSSARPLTIDTPAASVTPQQPQPQSQPEQAQQHQPHVHTQKAVTVFLVMAEIRSEAAMGFLQALQAHGTAQRIGDTVWLLRSDVSLEALHAALSQSLTRQDRLFILDSFKNKTAWSHIGADMDQRIRDMWAGA